MPSSAKPEITLVDGRSGAGKTVFATALARERGATLLSIDDAYPGWDGLDAGSWFIYRHVIEAIARGKPARYRRWDWDSYTYGEYVEVPTDKDLIIEGCGAIRQESARRATESIWLEAPEEVRVARALSRDGQAYAPLWRRWALQEERFLALHHSVEIATTLYYTGSDDPTTWGE
jgi:uridine kinase